MKQWDREGEEEALERKGRWWRDVRCGGEVKSRVESRGMIEGGARSLSPPAVLWLHQNKQFYLSESLLGFILSSLILKHPPSSFFVAFHSLLWSSPHSLTYFQCIIQARNPERRAWPLKKHEGYGLAAVSCHLGTGAPTARVARTRRGAR